MSTRDDIDREQFAELAAIFESEALEQIKNLTGVCFALEQSKDDPKEVLIYAFRQAHSLKGSAALLGFDRVAKLIHRVEDVLGSLKNGEKKVTQPLIDQLLKALEVIEGSVHDCMNEDQSLTAVERATLATLSVLLEQQEPVDLDEMEKPSEQVPLHAEPKDEPSIERSEATQKPSQAPQAVSRADSFIRISSHHLDQLIRRVDDLSEANIDMESITMELDHIGQNFGILGRNASRMKRDIVEEIDRPKVDEIEESINRLRSQVGALSKRFAASRQQLNRRILQAQSDLGQIRLAPISSLDVPLRKHVRQMQHLTGKKVDLFFEGGHYQVDRKVLEAVEEPLVHLIRNAVDHGIEPRERRMEVGKFPEGQILVAARHIGDAVELSISDDGQGIDFAAVRSKLLEEGRISKELAATLPDAHLLDHLFESGFSTHEKISEVSGRGVGLDVVKNTVERFGGEVRLTSKTGEGMRVTLRLPLTISNIRCLLVRVAHQTMAFPSSNIVRVVRTTHDETTIIGGGEVFEHDSQQLPVYSLAALLGLRSESKSQQEKTSRILVILEFGERMVVFEVDDVLEYAQLLLKPLGDLLERVPGISGVSFLGSRGLTLILNPGDLVRTAARTKSHIDEDVSVTEARILLVEDNFATRAIEKTLIEMAGFTAITASNGMEAMEILGREVVDLVLTDINMPEMDGIELTKTIKTDKHLNHLPVVVLSSLGAEEDIERGLVAGADAYILKKDLKQKELVDTIRRLL